MDLFTTFFSLMDCVPVPILILMLVLVLFGSSTACCCCDRRLLGSLLWDIALLVFFVCTVCYETYYLLFACCLLFVSTPSFYIVWYMFFGTKKDATIRQGFRRPNQPTHHGDLCLVEPVSTTTKKFVGIVVDDSQYTPNTLCVEYFDDQTKTWKDFTTPQHLDLTPFPFWRTREPQIYAFDDAMFELYEEWCSKHIVFSLSKIHMNVIRWLVNYDHSCVAFFIFFLVVVCAARSLTGVVFVWHIDITPYVSSKQYQIESSTWHTVFMQGTTYLLPRIFSGQMTFFAVLLYSRLFFTPKIINWNQFMLRLFLAVTGFLFPQWASKLAFLKAVTPLRSANQGASTPTPNEQIKALLGNFDIENAKYPAMRKMFCAIRKIDKTIDPAPDQRGDTLRTLLKRLKQNY